MNCNTIITKINKYLKNTKIKITILNPATIKSDYLSCEVIRCSDDGVSHICDLTGCGKASGRDFIGQLSAFCLIKAAVHIGIYDTAGYGIYRNSSRTKKDKIQLVRALRKKMRQRFYQRIEKNCNFATKFIFYKYQYGSCSQNKERT